MSDEHARRVQRRERIAARRRRAVATIAASFAACVMVVAGGVMAAGWVDGSAASETSETTAVIPSLTTIVEESIEGIQASAPDSMPEPEDDAEPFCTPAVRDAIATGDAEAVVVAAGGGEAFRSGVVDGRASDCISLEHPAWAWVVVNKQRPVEPIDYEPNSLVEPETFSPVGGHLTPAAATALDELASAAREAGVGEIALESGYRSHDMQVTTYDAQVGALGQADADLTSARPGYSEHQLGLAADVVACADGSCGTIYDVGATPQGSWVAENAWKHGWIVRYEEGTTDTTGYEPEPWHLRYVGQELARAYSEGGYATYEEFFGLSAAPSYE